MDIAALSMGMNQVQLMQQVDLSIVKMAMETGSNQADALIETVEMLDEAVPRHPPDPNLGQLLDMKV